MAAHSWAPKGLFIFGDFFIIRHRARLNRVEMYHKLVRRHKISLSEGSGLLLAHPGLPLDSLYSPLFLA
jgi:hypothetical protein